MEILYEDNHLFIVVKPAGMLTQPSGRDEISLESQAKEFIKKRDKKPGNVFLEAVHRLDKPVSGIVVFAKTSKALSRLNAAQREKKFRKIYRAEIEGHLPSKEGVLEHHLIHDHHKARVDPSGKPSSLRYRVVEKRKGTTVVEVELQTGRYHQIRAQFAHEGHPIVGDSKYGSQLPWKEVGIALRHSEIEFPHPIGFDSVKVTDPID